jgi:hypothetical protein
MFSDSNLKPQTTHKSDISHPTSHISPYLTSEFVLFESNTNSYEKIRPYCAFDTLQ